MPNRIIRCLAVISLIFVAPLAVSAQNASGRYAVYLRDEPLAKHFSSRADLQTTEAAAYRQRIETAQRAVKAELTKRGIGVTGSVSTLLNVVFVTMPASRVSEVRGIAGVLEVAPVRRHQLFLNRATTLMNGPQAWALNTGGQANAGAGIRIGVLDTGVDQTHPALQDSSLTAPPGFPKCSGFAGANTAAGCAAFTNGKVIVARSYVSQVAAGSDPNNPAVDSRPDDFTPRDHIGHGTATSSTAAGNTAVGSVTINGMAPKAYIGNYKVFGSPTVNDGTTEDVEVMALEDALADGMDVVSFSAGGPAYSGPLDTGSACDPALAAGVPCDLAAAAFEAAAEKGMPIVVAAGNAGSNGYNYPLYNSIETPGDAPGVITVGATTNSHGFTPLVEVTGASVPPTLNAIATALGDSYSSGGALTAPMIDVTQLGDNGYACTALPAHSLNGAIALIERGPLPQSASCAFAEKVTNAVAAGAWGVVIYNYNSTPIAPPGGLSAFTQPVSMISSSDGANLKTFIDANPGYPVTIEPSAAEQAQSANQLASFSSFGPSLGANGIKPDVLAVGESLYMPTQNYDILGEMFSSNRFIFAAGTSFSTPLTAGAAALVKQNHPGYTGQQIKSALVNTANIAGVATDDTGYPVNVLQTGGAGQVQADQAIRSTVTASPAAVSFGALSAGKTPPAQAITLTNTGAAAVALTLAVAGSSGVAVSPSTLNLAAGASGTATLTYAGAIPAANFYNGVLNVLGGAIALRIPWMYIVPAGAVDNNTNIAIVSGDFDDGTVNQIIPDGQAALQLIDDYGIPLAGVQVSWTADSGITLSQVSSVTDAFGIAYATVTMGPIAGQYSVYACVQQVRCTSAFVNNGGLGYAFTEYSRVAPAITSAGVVNAAGYQQPIAPGSYISIFGTNLYDYTNNPTGAASDSFTGLRLPLAIDYTTVSFDVPSAGISVPGRLSVVSAGQVNLQVPWELAGQPSAQVKVAIDFTNGNVVTVPLAQYSPAVFASGGMAAASNANGVVNGANPGIQGSYVSLYVNGLGPVTNQPASGEPALANPLSYTAAAPTVTIGGVQAQVLFSGLAPFEVGVYQLNVNVPTGLTPGNQPVVVSVGGVSSPAVQLPVK